MNSVNQTNVKRFVVLAALLGLLATVSYGAPVVLSNGVPVTGISGSAGSEQFYTIEVPAGQDELEISTSGGTGDVDLYVRRDSPPTTTSYDYRPYKVGNDETVTVANPVPGTWHIMLRGYTAYTGVTLQGAYSAAITITPLASGVPVTGLAGTEGTEKYFQIDVPAGQTKLEIAMSGGTGDADLYVKRGALPTSTVYDYRPFLFGNNETVTVNNPAAGTWYIMIRAYNAYTGLTLLASYGGGIGTVLENGVPVPNLSGSAGGEKIYRIDLPAGQTNLEIKMSGGTGDADLYVKFGTRPTVSDYDYRPFLAGNDETVTVNAPAGGTWYIMVRGYSAYAGVTLKASYGDVFTLQDGVPIPNLSGGLNSEKFYKLEVPSGQSNLLFRTSGGTGNVDVYIRRGAKPTTATWDHRLMQPGNAESVNIGNPQAGTWYVMLKGTQAYNGVTLEGDYSFGGTVILLSNNVPVPNIAGPASSEQFYKIEVPGGQSKLEIKMSGGTGDADLYVKLGSLPTTSSYDYRPYLIGNDETVTVNNPTGGTWFIMIRGYQAFTGVTLVATYGGGTPPPDEVTLLSNGVAVPGIAGAAGNEKHYKIVVPAGQAKLEIMTSGGTGDVDLYVRKDVKATSTDWDYRPYLIGNNETVTIDNPAAGTYYVMLRGYTAYTGVTLKATYLPAPDPVIVLENGVPKTGLSGAAGSEKHYKIDVPADQGTLKFEMSGGTGDADLYIRKGSKATTSSYDYRPYLLGNDESVEITNPAAATWYVMVRGYQAYSGVTLVATFGGQGNSFSSDPNAVALWRFEAGKLTVDSLSTNTLSNKGVTASTSDYKEGKACADFEFDEDDYMQIVDPNLNAKFPFKNGTSNRKISVCFWVRFESMPKANESQFLFTKQAPGKSSLVIKTFNSLGVTRLQFGIGYNNGLQWQITSHNSPLAADVWYHISVTYNDPGKQYYLRIWDDSAKAVLGADKSGVFNYNVSITNGAVGIGNLVDGLMDEMVVFNDILTIDEMDAIREGTYGKTP